jgi:TRAP-type mannitol/chloroaromatic compound transport system substrate-binding protein
VADHIGAASGGRIKMTVEIGGGIAPATKEFDAVDVGTLDFAVTCWMYWLDKFPAAGLFTMISGGMTPMGAISWFFEGGGYDLGYEMVEGYNVHLVRNGGWMGPPEAFLQSSKPLNSPSDISGMKIRGAGDGGEILSRMGASMVMMPAGEVFEAMQRGVIDAFEVSSPTLNWDLGLYEAADYLYLSGARQPYEYNPFIINKGVWDDLTPDLRQIITEVNEAETIRSYCEMMHKDLIAIENFQAYGTQVLPLPDSIGAAYGDVAKTFYDEKAAGDAFYAKVLESYWGWNDQLNTVWSHL